MGVRLLCPSCHRSLEAFRLHGGFQAGPLSPSTSRVYGRRRQSWQSNTAESVDHARELGSPRQKMAVELSVQERIPPEQLVGTLAGQQDLDAGRACQRGDLGDRDRALVGQRILIVFDRRHERPPPARRADVDRPQL